jgi:hypothetical protein
MRRKAAAEHFQKEAEDIDPGRQEKIEEQEVNVDRENKL